MAVSSEDEDDLLSDDDDSVASSSSTSQHSPPPPQIQQNQNFFAPPFYGRPPTPLPPSPSLTSLFLHPSRPTTPDASDDENINPVPRAAPKVPTYEYYGFVLYLFSSMSFLIYLLWSWLPSPFLHALGIYYYPNRWWALAIPSFLVMTICYIYVALAAYNTERLTVKMGSLETIVDGAGKIAVIDSKGRLKSSQTKGEKKRDAHGSLRWREIWNEGTDAVMDIPLGGVCEVLYGDGREDRSN